MFSLCFSCVHRCEALLRLWSELVRGHGVRGLAQQPVRRLFKALLQ